MKIRITKDLPVAPEIKPEIGSVHEVISDRDAAEGIMYIIKMGGANVGVFPTECEEVEP